MSLYKYSSYCVPGLTFNIKCYSLFSVCVFVQIDCINIDRSIFVNLPHYSEGISGLFSCKYSTLIPGNIRGFFF